MKFPHFFSLIILFGFYSCTTTDKNMPTPEKLDKLRVLVDQMQEEMEKISNDLDTVAHYYAFLISHRDSILATEPPLKYRFEGPFSTNQPGVDSTLSSVMILNTTPDREAALSEIRLTNSMDSVYGGLFNEYSIVAQVYSNSSLQVCRVYPSFDAKNITDPNIDVTDFNFFYEANLENNPSKGLVWIPDAYIDPAGKGWILSIIHPVYDGDSLSAVVGVDFTVSDLIETFLEQTEGEFILVNSSGDIVAGKAAAIEALSMPLLRNHVYRETIKSDFFRISDFNLFNSKSKEVRDMAKRFLEEKDSVFYFSTEPGINKALMMPFSKIDWYLIEIFSEL